MTLDRSARQQKVNLLSRVSESLQVLNNTLTVLFVGDVDIQEVLLSGIIDRESLEGQHTSGSELGLNRSGDVDRGLHSELLHSSLDKVELDGDNTGHLDSTTERDLSISLGKVQVSNRETSSVDVNRQEGLGSTGQVLDVTVSSVLGTSGNGTGTLLSDLLEKTGGLGGNTGVNGARLGKESNIAVGGVFAGVDELGLTAGPLGEELSGGSTSHDTGVDQTGELDTRDVTGRGEDSGEVPDSWIGSLLITYSFSNIGSGESKNSPLAA